MLKAIICGGLLGGATWYLITRGLGIGALPVTPSARTFTPDADVRSWTVPADVRTFTPDADPRSHTLETD